MLLLRRDLGTYKFVYLNKKLSLFAMKPYARSIASPKQIITIDL